MALDVLEHDGGPPRRRNSLKYPADDGRDFPARINFLLDVMKLAPNLERGQVLTEILVGHIKPPVTDRDAARSSAGRCPPGGRSTRGRGAPRSRRSARARRRARAGPSAACAARPT